MTEPAKKLESVEEWRKQQLADPKSMMSIPVWHTQKRMPGAISAVVGGDYHMSCLVLFADGTLEYCYPRYLQWEGVPGYV